MERGKKGTTIRIPFDFVSALGDEKSLCVGLDFGAPGIYGYFAVDPLLHALYLDGEQQQL